MEKHQIKVNINQCVDCGLCEKVCVAQNIHIQDQKAHVLSQDCVLCGHCTAVCPKKAISITGYHEEPLEKSAETRFNPEDVLSVIRFRRSVRQFQDRKIPKEVIAQILEAGRLTHTAKNLQDVSFIVLDHEKDSVERLAVRFFKKLKPLAGLFSPMARRSKIGQHFFFFQAPLVMVILAKEKTNGILAAQNMEFVAEANGLGVLFSGFFTIAANASRKVRKALQVPRGKRVAMTLVLGYPRVQFLRSVQREPLDVKYK